MRYWYDNQGKWHRGKAPSDAKEKEGLKCTITVAIAARMSLWIIFWPVMVTNH